MVRLQQEGQQSLPCCPTQPIALEFASFCQKVGLDFLRVRRFLILDLSLQGLELFGKGEHF